MPSAGGKMRRVKLIGIVTALCLAVAMAIGVTTARKPASPLSSLTAAKVQLMSAGPLAFGPDGILFVGDSIGGQVVAIDTRDRTPARAAKIDVDGINTKIAAMVGVAPDQIVINDMKVNPVSKDVYLSASRGRGPDAMPLIARVNPAGEITILRLDHSRSSSVRLSDAPKADPGARSNPRMFTITNMVYMNGDLLVTGLSNEEWSSALRSIPFPFKRDDEAAKGTTLKIWHSSHGRYETQAPIRTFVPYSIGGKEYVLAAYTCTPLVKIPFSALRPGAQVDGTTIADLGARNQPLDMVPYQKDGHDYILIANTARGVMKLNADNLQNYQPIDSPTVTDVAGVPYQTISDLKDVQHLAQLDSSEALILTGKPGPGPAWAPGPPTGPMNLQTIALP
jgi:hypothetical protein